ncbi:MAG TPA: sugar ABC transporter permease [Methanomassiliicoccales archaeon]|nr:sugar ABC transporter permease [Methanomassiliicoccales archaeon]
MKEAKTWVMLSPTIIVLGVFFIGALIYSVLLSLNAFSITSNSSISLQAYADVLGDKHFVESLLFSLKIAAVSTLISIVLAIIVSMVLRKTFVGKRIAVFVYQFNIPVPHLVVAVSVLLMLSQTGLISRLFYQAGTLSGPSSFPLIVFDQNGIGIIVAFVLKSFPFIGIAVLSLLVTTTGDYEQQAATLGANAWQRFRHVLLPMMTPSITFSSILVFAYAFGSFEVPFLLGSTSPKALALLAYQDYTSVDLNTRPEAMAIANIITLIMAVVVILAYRRLDAVNKRGEAGHA